MEGQAYLRSFPSKIGGGRCGVQGGRQKSDCWIIFKIIFEIIYKMSHRKCSFKWRPMLLHAAIFLPSTREKCSVFTVSLPPTSEQRTGTFQRSQELNQNYISLAVSETSKTVHFHWLLEARRGLIIIILRIHRPLCGRECLQTSSCSSPYY